MTGQTDQGDIAALAKGGRTNFMGFLLRLAARLPFLFIAAAARLGRPPARGGGGAGAGTWAPRETARKEPKASRR